MACRPSPEPEVAGPASSAHREIVSYLAADWSSVKRQLDQQDRRVELYQERSNPRLAGLGSEGNGHQN